MNELINTINTNEQTETKVVRAEMPKVNIESASFIAKLGNVEYEDFLIYGRVIRFDCHHVEIAFNASNYSKLYVLGNEATFNGGIAFKLNEFVKNEAKQAFGIYSENLLVLRMKVNSKHKPLRMGELKFVKFSIGYLSKESAVTLNQLLNALLKEQKIKAAIASC